MSIMNYDDQAHSQLKPLNAVETTLWEKKTTFCTPYSLASTACTQSETVQTPSLWSEVLILTLTSTL